MAGKNGKFKKLLRSNKICLGTNDFEYFKEKDQKMEQETIRATIDGVMV